MPLTAISIARAQDGGQSSLQKVACLTTTDGGRCGDSTLSGICRLQQLCQHLRTMISPAYLRAECIPLYCLPRGRRKASSVARRPRSFTGRVNNIPVAFYGFLVLAVKFFIKAYPNKWFSSSVNTRERKRFK